MSGGVRDAGPGLTRRGLSDHVADAVVRMAADARLVRGDALPPVTKLAEELQVSRAVVRDALGRLAERRLIERCDGRGWAWRAARVPRERAHRPDGAPEVVRTSLAEQAASAVLDLIRADGLRAGDAIPSTRELAERFGVSVLVLREALAELAARGILRRHQGRESVVAVPADELVSAIMSFRAYVEGIEVDEFQSARASLEIKAAALAAERPDADAKRARLAPPLDGMRAAVGGTAFNRHDLAFHMAIAELCDNRAIAMLMASLNDLVRTSLVTTYRRVSVAAGASGIAVAVRNHERIADAIVAGDPRAAARAMERHFAFVFLDDAA
ncbi:MAG TPA: GntR family transcriptional regulator [Conexibacter sp.]|nr:GntR family transcriptional regulator [Conexibacter sp.]